MFKKAFLVAPLLDRENILRVNYLRNDNLLRENILNKTEKFFCLLLKKYLEILEHKIHKPLE